MGLFENDHERQEFRDRMSTAAGLMTDEEHNQQILQQLEAYKANGVIDYVVPTKPLGQQWVIGYRGEILKLDEKEVTAWLLGAAAVIRRVGQRMGLTV